MFTITDNKFNEQLILTERVSQDVINDKYIRYFDNDGFELSYLEQEFYREHKIPLNNILNHHSNHFPWIECNDKNFKLDHCTLSQRWSFEGNARLQLLNSVQYYPQLVKYLNLKPKWGLDFALEYYHDDVFLEVLHFEMDYHSYEDAVEAKMWFENKILQTDWMSFVSLILSTEDDWRTLRGMEQNDWKARLWGLDKAEITLKTWNE